MADETPVLENAAPGQLRATGPWLLDDAARLSRAIERVCGPVTEVDASGISRLDAAGALLLLKLLARFDLPAELLALRPEHAALVSAVAAADHREQTPSGHAPPTWRVLLVRIGKTVVALGQQLAALLSFLGLTLVTLSRLLLNPRRLRLTATVHHMEQTGFDAVPLVALLSFLVGAVVAFLGATVLRDFGADLFVVELVSFAFLREFGVLLTAILLAGRTASRFQGTVPWIGHKAAQFPRRPATNVMPNSAPNMRITVTGNSGWASSVGLIITMDSAMRKIDTTPIRAPPGPFAGVAGSCVLSPTTTSGKVSAAAALLG
ncbi:MAG: hypothetical protein CVV17_04280 [Gammaproteobacteria bacterium HGW-Gammaproteobacteria-7]|nr:MAG: hypothetical protein CVV17_04280 [Gammaproteobacteria bacterium HGW-Gammaproteobacteria-7]